MDAGTHRKDAPAAAKEFFIWFQHEAKRLKDEISRPDISDFSPLVTEINSLEKQCRQHSGEISNYDLQTYQNIIDTLRADIEQRKPKPKFSFSRRLLSKKTSSVPQENEKSLLEVLKSSALAAGVPKITGLSSQVWKPAGEERALLIESAKSCLIDLSSHKISSLKLVSLVDCIVYVGMHIPGPIFTTSCENCVFVFMCQQLRMHNCRNCCVVLSCLSEKGIIESCRDLQFAQFPDKLLSDPASQIHNWEIIEDFDNPTDNTNWSNVSGTSKIAKLPITLHNLQTNFTPEHLLGIIAELTAQ